MLSLITNLDIELVNKMFHYVVDYFLFFSQSCVFGAQDDQQ